VSTFDPEQFQRAMDRAPKALLDAFDPAMRRHARGFLQGTLVRQRLSGRPGLMNRTGGMRRSFNFEVTNADRLDSWTLTEFSNHPGARIQEYGGTITGKPWLAIPLPAARTAAGASRGSLRSFKNTFFAKSKAGNLLLFQRNGKSITPLFVMKSSVTIPARLGFGAAHAADQPPRVEVLRKAVAQALEGLRP
jgi:hypothetical protein